GVDRRRVHAACRGAHGPAGGRRGADVRRHVDVRPLTHQPWKRGQVSSPPLGITAWYSGNCAAVAQAWLDRMRSRVPTGKRSAMAVSMPSTRATTPCSWLVLSTV